MAKVHKITGRKVKPKAVRVRARTGIAGVPMESWLVSLIFIWKLIVKTLQR